MTANIRVHVRWPPSCLSTAIYGVKGLAHTLHLA